MSSGPNPGFHGRGREAAVDRREGNQRRRVLPQCLQREAAGRHQPEDPAVQVDAPGRRLTRAAVGVRASRPHPCSLRPDPGRLHRGRRPDEVHLPAPLQGNHDDDDDDDDSIFAAASEVDQVVDSPRCSCFLVSTLGLARIGWDGGNRISTRRGRSRSGPATTTPTG